MTQDTSPKRTTAPKGRPTRSRNGRYRNRRAFGPTAQWIAAALALVVAFIIAFLLLDGGDFNPFNDDTAHGVSDGTVTNETSMVPMSQPVNIATF
jgi:hypothetical protein